MSTGTVTNCCSRNAAPEARTPLLEMRGCEHLLRPYPRACTTSIWSSIPARWSVCSEVTLRANPRRLKRFWGSSACRKGRCTSAVERADTLTIAERIERGMAVVPENRRIFPKMTVRENLEMGSYLRNDRKAIRSDIDYVFTLFPRLSERLNAAGRHHVGGRAADAGDGPRPDEPP